MSKFEINWTGCHCADDCVAELGHHSIEMTQRYAHLAPDYLRRSVEVLAQPAPKPAPEIISA